MNSRPIICQVLHSLVVGGAEVLAAQLARRLSGQHDFRFACLDELGTLGEQLRREGFVVEVFGRRPGIDLRCMARLRQFWRQEKADLVHAHQYTPFFYAAAARGFGRRPPILFTEHGRFYPDYPRRKRMLFNRLALRRTDRVVGVGEAVRRALIANEGLPGERVGVIYNGVDASAFDRTNDDRAAVRHELGIGPADLVLVQVARLDYLKDHATAVRTMERVVACRPDARLLLVGEGPEQAKIEAETTARGLGQCVCLVGLRRDVPRLLHAADLFLLTSISEGIPVTLIEAMTAALPVVATDVGGVGEVVAAGETGLLAPAGDDQALAEAVLRVAGDPELRIQMGSRARARAQDLFSEAQMHAQYEQLYREMLRG